MKAAMPVPYIIALIIGVIVVAVLAYWFISSGTKGSNIGTEAECSARKVEFCATKLSEKLTKARECDDNSWPDTEACSFCRGLIPGWSEKDSRVDCGKST